MDLLDIREMFGKEVIDISLEEAIARGWLPRIEYHLVTDDSFDEEALQKIAQEVLEENQRISLDELNRRLFIRARDEKVAEIIHGYNEKTIVFCRNIEHAEHFKTFLRLSAIFHSKNGKGQKDVWERNQAALEDLRNGTLLRVLAVNAFNEGVDVPSISLVVFYRVTDSEIIFRQQLGRGMRPGKDKLVVLDFVGNVERILMLKKMADKTAEIHQESTTPEERDREGYRRERLHLSGRGFEFTFSDKLVELFKVVERIQVEFYLTWEEAGVAARKIGIRTRDEYTKEYRKDSKLPSSPFYEYENFPGWPMFLRETPKKYRAWRKASVAARRLKIRTEEEYVKRYKEDARLPSSPSYQYADFPGWPMFLRNETTPKLKIRSDFYPTLEEAQIAARRLNLRSRVEYARRYKEDLHLPSAPNEIYPHFPGWKEFFQVRYPTWEEASIATQRLGIQSIQEYWRRKKEDPRLPGDPRAFYKNFPGLNKFLGKE